ncbi:MAG: putative sulfate exporter family transporter [Nakamurella sp.]
MLPGIVITAVLATIATWLGGPLPLIGAPVIGIILGVLLSVPARRFPVLEPGIRFTGRIVLQIAVVVLGTQLSLRQVAEVGLESLPVMLGTLIICLIAAFALGRAMHIDTDLRTLIGVGTAICGASAIAAVTPIIRPKNAAVAYAISTIFLFNVAAVLIFPQLGYLFDLSQHEFGLFAGTAVNDTSSVVAAATSYGAEAGNFAVVVKLTRTLMIIPICVFLAAMVNRRDHRSGRSSDERTSWVVRYTRLVPWFLVGFLVAAAINSAGWVSASAQMQLHTVATFLITAAMTAIGLSTNFIGLRRAGVRPLLLGLILWLLVTASSLALILLAR